MNRRHFVAAAAGTPALFAAQAVPQAAGLHLKITGLKTFVVHVGITNWVFCKIYTNQGITGLGEGEVGSKEATVAQAIMEHERALLGQDPTNIELLWQRMFRRPRWRGGPILNSAISAVEIALWDILGKALGVPIYKLLGGAARERVRINKDVGLNPDAFLRVKAEGYTAAKCGVMSLNAIMKNRVTPNFAVHESARRLEAVRKAVGDEFDISFDAHGQFTTVMAVDFCDRVKDLKLFFVEEPTQLEDLDELALLRQQTKVPLATGERAFTKYGFVEFCVRHLVNYVQPDVCHAGGILELKKIGAIAEAHRVEMALHSWGSVVNSLASLHVHATTPAATIMEYASEWAPWTQELFGGVTLQVKGGHAELPDRPGLGVDLNEKLAAQHPYQPADGPNYTFPDGSVADR